jgi:uncharacterized membrane-anchored protein YhcB (DUF1043 family)
MSRRFYIVLSLIGIGIIAGIVVIVLLKQYKNEQQYQAQLEAIKATNDIGYPACEALFLATGNFHPCPITSFEDYYSNIITVRPLLAPTLTTANITATAIQRYIDNAPTIDAACATLRSPGIDTCATMGINTMTPTALP